MARFNVTDLVLTMNGSPVAHCDSAELTIEADLPDATTKGSAGWEEHIRGVRKANFDVSGLIDYSASFGADEMADAIINRTPLTALFTRSGASNTRYTAEVDVSQLKQGGSKEEPAKWSGAMKVNGAITKGTNP